jgi:hypothetical protein
MARGQLTKAVILVAALAAVGVIASSSAGASPARRRCSSFASQKAAQRYFVRSGGSQSKDAAGLDPDGDGLVCPMNAGPFAAYVEIGFAHGFFYGTLVCVNYPPHMSKAELRKEERNREAAVKEGAKKLAPEHCSSSLIEVQLTEAGSRKVVASHKAEAAEEPTSLPIGASERNIKGEILSFEYKLEPAKTKGTFFASSEECYGTPSRKIKGG